MCAADSDDPHITDADFIAGMVRRANDEALAHVSVAGSDPEYVTLYFPKGRRLTAVNIVATPGMDIERQREALLTALLQLDRTQ